MIKKFFRLLTIVMTFTLLLAGCSTASSNAAKKSSTENTATVTYTLKQNNKQFAKKTVTVKKTATVLTGLEKAWTVKQSKGFVTAIDGKSQNPVKKTYWLYTVNGKSATKGVTQTKVANKDKIVFSLTPTK